MRMVECDFGIGRVEGEIVKDNKHTIRVKIRRGGKVFIIKRHKVKHGVVFLNEHNKK